MDLLVATTSTSLAALHYFVRKLDGAGLGAWKNVWNQVVHVEAQKVDGAVTSTKTCVLNTSLEKSDVAPSAFPKERFVDQTLTRAVVIIWNAVSTRALT